MCCVLMQLLYKWFCLGSCVYCCSDSSSDIESCTSESEGSKSQHSLPVCDFDGGDGEDVVELTGRRGRLCSDDNPDECDSPADDGGGSADEEDSAKKSHTAESPEEREKRKKREAHQQEKVKEDRQKLSRVFEAKRKEKEDRQKEIKRLKDQTHQEMRFKILQRKEEQQNRIKRAEEEKKRKLAALNHGKKHSEPIRANKENHSAAVHNKLQERGKPTNGKSPLESKRRLQPAKMTAKVNAKKPFGRPVVTSKTVKNKLPPRPRKF